MCALYNRLIIIKWWLIAPSACIVLQDSTLRKYVEMNLERTWNSFEVISEDANKEHSLEKAVDKMLHEWDEVKTII